MASLIEVTRIRMQAFEEADAVERIRDTLVYKLSQLFIRVDDLLKKHDAEQSYITRDELRKAINGEHNEFLNH